MGRVKSLQKEKEKILKPQNNSRGYLRVQLRKNSNYKYYFIHRLVAEAFVTKADGYNVVNHIDCNPHNNCADNLEWTTQKGNLEYMIKMGRNKRNKEWISKLTETQRMLFGKSVVRISIMNNEIKKYETLNQVKDDGFNISCVSNCCNGIRKTHKGYKWEFYKEYDSNKFK